MSDVDRGHPGNPDGCAADVCNSSSGWKTHAMRSLVRQFGQPRGFWGKIAGLIMAMRPSNVRRNLWTIELLEIRPTDRVLEIGFGPGIGIAAASRRATEGLVVGLDHSEVMLRQATRRNMAAVLSGRVQLQLGPVENLSSPRESFDKIYAVNSVAFWEEPVQRLLELRSLLSPGGVIALTEQPRLHKGSHDAADRAGARIASQVEQAGFVDLRVDTLPMKPIAAVCVRGWTGVGHDRRHTRSDPVD